MLVLMLMSNCLNNVELGADLKKDTNTQLLTGIRNGFLILTPSTFFFVGMYDAKLQQSNSMGLLGLKSSADMRWKHYIDSTDQVTPRKIVSL